MRWSDELRFLKALPMQESLLFLIRWKVLFLCLCSAFFDTCGDAPAEHQKNLSSFTKGAFFSEHQKRPPVTATREKEIASKKRDALKKAKKDQEHQKSINQRLAAFRQFSSARGLFSSRFEQTAQQRGLLDFDALKSAYQNADAPLFFNGFRGFQSRSKTACRGFKSFCPCHQKSPESLVK